MRYETVSATNIQHFCAPRNDLCDFQCHVVGAAYCSASSFPLPSTLEASEWSKYYLRSFVVSGGKVKNV
jgi:hypothetical protein